jgi:hypothetical protein
VGGTGLPAGGTGLPVGVGGTGNVVVGGVGGAAGVAGGLIVDGAVPGAQGVVVLVGAAGAVVLFWTTPAVGLDGFASFTPDVVAGLLAVVLGICAGVFVPGVVAVAVGVAPVAGAAAVVDPGVVEPALDATGVHGTGVGTLGEAVVGAGWVVVVGAGDCASGLPVIANAPASANRLIDRILLFFTWFPPRSMSFDFREDRCIRHATNGQPPR